MFGAEDVESYEGLRMQESVFGVKTIDGPNDWVFRYVHVTDSHGQSVVSAVLTAAQTKSDMLSDRSVSEKMEAMRDATGESGCQTLVMVGSLLSEGKVFVDRSHPSADKAIARLLAEAESFREDMGADGVMMRGLDEASVSSADMLDGDG